MHPAAFTKTVFLPSMSQKILTDSSAPHPAHMEVPGARIWPRGRSLMFLNFVSAIYSFLYLSRNSLRQRAVTPHAVPDGIVCIFHKTVNYFTTPAISCSFFICISSSSLYKSRGSGTSPLFAACMVSSAIAANSLNVISLPPRPPI